VRVFVTGGTGFIGGHVVSKLRERGDDVVALVRDPAKAGPLEASGATPVEGDLSDRRALATAMDGCDAMIHIAAYYAIGLPAREREAMRLANVVGTENALGAALDAGVDKAVYVSTVVVYGNTRGQVVDEGYQRPRGGYTSYYEETKTEAHDAARRLIDEGLPCVIVCPGAVYGPDDPSVIGKQISDFLSGRMLAIPFPDAGSNYVHVDDVAAGILLALDRGGVGESYNLGGEIGTMRGLIETLARVSGRKAPKRDLPTGLVKAMIPLGPVVGKVMGQPPNLRELVSMADGVTFWGGHDKAVRELGYSPRSLEAGLRDTLQAAS
jgi:nucleoside-diphosphate-sugar epimerase